MLNRKVVTALVIVAALVLIVRPEILGGIFAFIFLGLIPGTSLSVPSIVMFVIYAIVAILVIRWLVRQPMYVGNMSRQEKTARAIARKKVLAKKKKPVRKSAVRRAKKVARA